MSAQITHSEMLESLTGYDEQAITKHFGGDVIDFANEKPTTYQRALVFIHLMREESLDSTKAKDRVMRMSLRECADLFRDDEDDEAPEVGEGEQPADETPTT